VSTHFKGCGVELALGCRAPTDVCRTTTDCADGTGEQKACAFVPGATGEPSSWQCTPWTCSGGRPFVVAGEARVASPIERADWSAPFSVAPCELAGQRSKLTAHWLAVAALEHASIASFARFTLQLLALGAPPALLVEAQRAALDEVEHARIAYGIASAYAGVALGPGPLDIQAGLASLDRASTLVSLVTEACVGETLGVVEAMALADAAGDPELRAACERIAADEQRHAELGWRALAWLLASATESERTLARRTFDEAIARPEPIENGTGAPQLGLLGADARRENRRRAITEVIGPCAALMLPRASVAAPMASLIA
jgi:hypothetical protein